MSEVKHTPIGGEWWPGSDDDANCVFTTQGGDETKLVCEVDDCDCNPDVQQATTQLIAAAPDLLATCRMLADARFGDIANVIAAMDAADAAIRKATGGT